MNIYVDPDGMKRILEDLYRVQHEIKKLSEQYKEIESNLDLSIKNDLSINPMLKEAEAGLEKLCQDSSGYSSFMEYVLEEYQQAEKKLLTMVERLPETSLSHRYVGYSVSKVKTQVKKNTEIPVEKLVVGDRIHSCHLPQKEVFFKHSVKSGIVYNGRNILIRAWSVPEKE